LTPAAAYDGSRPHGTYSVPAVTSALPGGSISACIVAYNEERVIERCLASLRGAVDEIVLVHDGPCTDRTLEIAAEHGARVFVREHAGHGEHHRPFAYEQARGEWVLRIDADEFLSDALRAELRELVRDTRADGFEFEWRMWDGTRYVTEGGPFRLALMRRSTIRLLGLIQHAETVDGEVVRTDLLLEHRPLYNNFSLPVMATKWRRWADVQAREYLGDRRTAPGYRVPVEPWPWSRRVSNRLAPLLLLPHVAATFSIAFGRLGTLGLRRRIRFSVYQAIYVGLVQAQLVKLLYVDPLRRSRPEDR
jgi:glycosyltransferase involved in cell wall biosynthesis